MTGTDQLRICMVAYGVGKTDGTFVGGHVNNLINVSMELASRGHAVHVVTTPPVHSDTPRAEPWSHEGVQIHPVDSWRQSTSASSKKGRIPFVSGGLSAPLLIKTIRSLDDQYDFDIVHGHSGFPWVGYVPELSTFLRDTHAVHTLYCPVPRSRAVRALANSCFVGIDRVISVSRNVRASLPRCVSNSPVIPPLIDLDAYRPTPDTTYDNDNLGLLYMGNLSEEKGLDTLVDAVAQLDDESLTVYLALDMSAEQYARGEYEVKDRIHAHGLADVFEPVGIVDDLPNLMNRVDAFVVPFRGTQGPADYPLSMLEAMACGLPVVGSAVGGIPEVLTDGETGLLISPDDPAELATSIRTLRADAELRSTLGSAARDRIDSMMDSIVDRYQEEYRQVREA